MVRRSIWVGFFVLSLACGFKTSTSLAQAVYGSILGTVTDPQGSSVAGAKVTVTSLTKGTAEETTTNESGNYSVTHLIPDTYKVRIEANGFKALDIPSIQISADTGSRVDATMQVGAVTQSVEVTDDLPQLKTDRADVAITFNQKYVQDLPILNRNFTTFELLSPGTQKLTGFSHAATENPQGGQQIFVNGQHFSGTAFELDGTDNQDPILGIIVVNPNLDAIQESKITLQNYDAEFGKAVAGIVTVQTKSGSNHFHGSGFYDYRGDGKEARNPFTNPPNVPLPAASFKQFGGAVGGPILKDKLFFFGDYQGTRQTNGITNQLSIPTALVQRTCNPATSTTGFCDLSEYLGNANVNSTGQIYDPATGNPLNGSGRTPFASNHIPIGRISPQAAAILALFPAPTAPGVTNNFIGSGSGPYNQNSFDTRIDYNAPRGFNIFGRFSLDYFNLNGTGTLGVLGGDGLNVGRSNCPLTESEQQFQFVNNWTRVKGNHQIKFGADIRYAANLRVPSDANRTGILNLHSGDTSNGGTGGLDLATFLPGEVTSFNRFVSTSLNAAERQKRWFFYGQDTWRVTPKLSFNYGLRWEIYFPETVNGARNGGFANLDQGIIRVARVGNNGLNGNTNNALTAFAPRLGFAYQYDPKTVLRLGYGRSYDIGVVGSHFGHVVTRSEEHKSAVQ